MCFTVMFKAFKSCFYLHKTISLKTERGLRHCKLVTELLKKAIQDNLVCPGPPLTSTSEFVPLNRKTNISHLKPFISIWCAGPIKNIFNEIYYTFHCHDSWDCDLLHLISKEDWYGTEDLWQVLFYDIEYGGCHCDDVDTHFDICTKWYSRASVSLQ